MADAIKLFGVLLICFGIALPAFGIFKSGKNPTASANRQLLVIGLLAVFAGAILVLQDRITELTVKGVGTIRAATLQAVSDAKDVANLKERVENQSATVDLVAGQAKKANDLSEAVSAQIKQAEEKLSALNETIKEANAALTALRQEEDFTATVLAAQNDDRPSFDKLREVAEKPDDRFAKMAAQAWSTVFEAHSGPMSQAGFTVPWSNGVEPGKLSLETLVDIYNSSQLALRPALLEYIWNRNDIPKIARLDFLMKVMKSDTSLTAMEYAGRYFVQGTSQKIKPMALDYLGPWWDAHRHDFDVK